MNNYSHPLNKQTTGRTPPHKGVRPVAVIPEPPPAGEGGEVTDGAPGRTGVVPGFPLLNGVQEGPTAAPDPPFSRTQRLSLPFDSAAARPASRRATGIRKGEQET